MHIKKKYLKFEQVNLQLNGVGIWRNATISMGLTSQKGTLQCLRLHLSL